METSKLHFNAHSYHGAIQTGILKISVIINKHYDATWGVKKEVI